MCVSGTRKKTGDRFFLRDRHDKNTSALPAEVFSFPAIPAA
jgi:hypothetical protein